MLRLDTVQGLLKIRHIAPFLVVGLVSGPAYGLDGIAKLIATTEQKAKAANEEASAGAAKQAALIKEQAKLRDAAKKLEELKGRQGLDDMTRAIFGDDKGTRREKDRPQGEAKKKKTSTESPVQKATESPGEGASTAEKRLGKSAVPTTGPSPKVTVLRSGKRPEKEAKTEPGKAR